MTILYRLASVYPRVVYAVLVDGDSVLTLGCSRERCSQQPGNPATSTPRHGAGERQNLEA